jgi:DNA-binding MarR family transcriptional regulator
VLVEDRLPGVVIRDAVMNDQGDGHGWPPRASHLIGYLSCQTNKYQMSSSTSSDPEAAGGSQLDAREAWHRLLQVSSRVLRRLDSSLDRHERMSVSEFDVLITLDNAPDRRLRMTDLARATMLSSGGMTRLVGRLEDRGLVRRDPDPQDARAFRATLTPAGQSALARARATHDEVIADLLGARLRAAEVKTLEDTLAKVLAADSARGR